MKVKLTPPVKGDPYHTHWYIGIEFKEKGKNQSAIFACRVKPTSKLIKACRELVTRDNEFFRNRKRPITP